MPLIDFAWFCQPASQGMVPRQEPSVSDWPLPGLRGKHLRMATGRTVHTPSQNFIHKELRRTHASNHCKGPHRTAISIAENCHYPCSSSNTRFSEAASRSTPWRFQVLNWPPGVCRLNRCLNMPKQSLPQSQKMSLPVLPAKLPYRCALPTKQVATWRCIHGQPTTTACVYCHLHYLH